MVHRRLSATEQGIWFYDYAKHIVDRFDEMTDAMVSPDWQGRLRIGSSITIGDVLVPDVIRQFRHTDPGCEVEVVIRNSHQIFLVLSGQLIEGEVREGGVVRLPLYPEAFQQGSAGDLSQEREGRLIKD